MKIEKEKKVICYTVVDKSCMCIHYRLKITNITNWCIWLFSGKYVYEQNFSVSRVCEAILRN